MDAPQKVPGTAAPAAVVTTATAAELSFLIHLQKRFSNQLGFLPRGALVEYIDAGRAKLVTENDQPAGYIITRARLRSAKWCRPVTQAAICYDAQRRHLGLALLAQEAAEARRDRMEALQAWVAEDIDAMHFFGAAGFTAVAARDPKNARGRRLILLRKSLTPKPHADFWKPPTVAGCVPRRIIPTECVLVQRTA
jgi:N-acetylglutamate synthase-like GNAT family acetyltransferase